MYRFLKKESTACVNGVFILIVFISHLRNYMMLEPHLEWAMKGLSQLMVAMFLFYSGFGVMESIEKKGMTYVRQIPLHRVLRVLAMYIPAVLLYGLLDLILGIPFTTGQFFLSLVAWLNLGNSNWYIFVILCLYLITWVAWMIADKISGLRHRDETNASDYRDTWGWILTLILSAGLILVLRQTTPEYYYNTISAYLFGLFFSQNKDCILRACGFDKSGKLVSLRAKTAYVIMTVLMIGTVICLRLLYPHGWSQIVFLLMTVFFCMAVVLLSYLVPFPDCVFRWFGEHLFEVYILMRMPMMALQRVPGWEQGGVWYALSCLAITVILAWIFHAVSRFFQDRLRSRTSP